MFFTIANYLSFCSFFFTLSLFAFWSHRTSSLLITIVKPVITTAVRPKAIHIISCVASYSEKFGIRPSHATKRKIAICDVFLQCYFNNNSSLDNDIILNDPLYPAMSNKETIKNIIDNSNIKYVVVNSRFVQKQFEKMHITGDFEVKYVVSPSPRKGSIDSKLSSWQSVFNELNKD